MPEHITDDSASTRIFPFRLPRDLEQQLRAVAAREHNTLSATVRRLISVGLRAELRQDASRG